MVFRFTKNALELIEAETLPSASCIAENRYCEWFVDIAYASDCKEYFLITNAYSLYSIAVPSDRLYDKNAFFDFVLKEMKEYFYERKHEDLFNQFIAPNLENIKITKTNNRSVTASMNNSLKVQISFSERLSKVFPDQNERFLLNDRLNKELCKCSNTGVGDYTFAEDFISSDLMKLPLPKETSAPQQKAPSKPVAKKKKPAVQLYAELCDMKPKIWRRFIISQNASMEDLAFALMAQFNMNGSHLYRFNIPLRSEIEEEAEKRGISIEELPEIFKIFRDIEINGFTDEEMDAADDDFMINELHQMPPIRHQASKTKIKDFAVGENKKFNFYYDFGDDWEFKIVCENTDASDLLNGTQPFVLDGKGLGIIEDCGGIGGLEDIKEAFKKKSGEEYENYCEWLGEDSIDFESFDVEAINKNMKRKIKMFKDMREE